MSPPSLFPDPGRAAEARRLARFMLAVTATLAGVLVFALVAGQALAPAPAVSTRVDACPPASHIALTAPFPVPAP